MNAPQVIFNADDFGRSPEINAAVIRAHREGVLTSASLMVTGDAFEEAVGLAHANPMLAVGLHLVTACGRAVLPPAQIPHLVDAQGYFPGDSVRISLRYAFSRAARTELAQEIAAQFERFAATGLPLSHVDGHMHMHLHPAVFLRLLPLAERYGAHGIRVPRDDLRLVLDYGRTKKYDGFSSKEAPWNGSNTIAKIVWASISGPLCRWCIGRLRGRRLIVPERVYGLLQTGHMEKQYVTEVLRHLQASTAEIYLHPTAASIGDEPLGPNPGDLATLLSPAIRQVIKECGLRLTTYPALQREKEVM